MALAAGLTYGVMAGVDGAPVRIACTIVGSVAASEFIGPLLTRDPPRGAGVAAR